jgi:MFS family permease
MAFAWLRGLLGFAEGSANPAGMKATAEWFPAKERGLAGGIYNIGASVGSMFAPPLVAWAILAYNWRAAFVITGSLGLMWAVVWLLLAVSDSVITVTESVRRAKPPRLRSAIAAYGLSTNPTNPTPSISTAPDVKAHRRALMMLMPNCF